MRLVFVCTGNICRSPIAERLAVAHARQRGIRRIDLSSAGTRAIVGHPVHAQAARVLEGLGGDPAGFRARRLTLTIAGSADLILTMTAEHRDEVLSVAPQKLKHTFTLLEVAKMIDLFGARTIDDLPVLRPQLSGNGGLDIADPIGCSDGVFSEVGAQIAALVPKIVDCCARSSP